MKAVPGSPDEKERSMEEKTFRKKELLSGYRMHIAAGIAAGALISLGVGLIMYQRRRERKRIIAL